jgi:hypothetical protein
MRFFPFRIEEANRWQRTGSETPLAKSLNSRIVEIFISGAAQNDGPLYATCLDEDAQFVKPGATDVLPGMASQKERAAENFGNCEDELQDEAKASQYETYTANDAVNKR